MKGRNNGLNSPSRQYYLMKFTTLTVLQIFQSSSKWRVFLVRRLSKLPALWVYFPFSASLIVFVWTKEPLWFSQIPGRLLCLRNSPFSSVVVPRLPLNFEWKSILFEVCPFLVALTYFADFLAPSQVGVFQWNTCTSKCEWFSFQRIKYIRKTLFWPWTDKVAWRFLILAWFLFASYWQLTPK